MKLADFYIGIYNTAWIPRMEVPFMVSRRRLAARKKLPLSNVPYALDSGGFTELSLYGKWSIGERRYADDVHHIVDRGGAPVFVAPQDRMCEPFICEKTGKTVVVHIQETVENYLTLREIIDPSIYLLPVIQGYTLDEYLACVDLYQRNGIDLRQYPVVGLGSICRRQRTLEGITIIRVLASLGVRLHGFGLKTTALRGVSGVIKSADSMAWSLAGRWAGGKANDFDYMLSWRQHVLESIPTNTQQLLLF